MSKKWKTIRNDTSKKSTKEERVRQDRSFANLINNTKTLSVKDLKAESKELYAAKIAEEDQLLEALENKKLKSKEALKRAFRIKKDRVKNPPRYDNFDVDEVEDDTKNPLDEVNEVEETEWDKRWDQSHALVGMSESADDSDLKSDGSNPVWVQVPLPTFCWSSSIGRAADLFAIIRLK